MKKIICTLATFLFTASLLSCSSENNESSSKPIETTTITSTETSTIPTTSTITTTFTTTTISTTTRSSLEAMDDIEIEKNLLTVSITIPSEFINSDDELLDIDNEEGIISHTKNDDGSMTVVMTREAHKKLMEDLTKALDEGLKEIESNDLYPTIIGVSHNNDFSEFTITVTDESSFRSSSDSFASLAFYFYAGYYSTFSGNKIDDVSIKFIDNSTGQEFTV